MGITTSNNALQISVVARNIERGVVPKLFVSKSKRWGQGEGEVEGEEGNEGCYCKVAPDNNCDARAFHSWCMQQYK